MRILYLSCHSILEFQEVSLMTELGHYCFSPGAYVEPRNVGDATMRPDLPISDAGMATWIEDRAAFNSIEIPAGTPAHYMDRKYHLTQEFVSRFDAVVVMHLPDFIHKNWDALKCRPIVWRTIGQSVSHTEAEMKKYRDAGMKIMRYSPRELNIPGQIGSDAIIRFYMDENEFTGWTGHKEQVITFNQAMPGRVRACNYELWQSVVAPFAHTLYGPGNEEYGSRAVGKVPYHELKQALRDNRAYFYVGTHPASYTLNFMESFMTGIPVVALGPVHGNANYDFHNHNLYEVPDFIEDGVNGFCRDEIGDLQAAIAFLFLHPKEAAEMGARGRKRAIELFGKQPIKEQWRAFLAGL